MRRSIALLGTLLACGDGGDGRPDASPTPDAPPAEGTWESLDPMPSPLQESAVVALDGKIYVIGGINGARVTVDTVQIYDVAMGVWSEGPDLPLPIHHVNAAAVDGTIHVVGALRSGFLPTGIVLSWIPGDPEWTVGSAMPAGTERGASAVGVVGGRILLAGGLGEGTVDRVSIYDPSTGDWEDGPDLPALLDHGTGQSVDGVFYAIGGRTGSVTSITNRVYAFDGATWQERAPMPTARGGIASGVIAGAIVVVGGEGNRDDPQGVFPQAELYDPAADRWSALPEMPTPRHGMGGAVVDGGFHVPGGAAIQGFGVSGAHEVLRLPDREP